VIAPLRLALEPDPRLTPSRDCDAHPHRQAVIFWVWWSTTTATVAIATSN